MAADSVLAFAQPPTGGSVPAKAKMSCRDSTPTGMVNVITSVTDDRTLRQTSSAGARQLAEGKFLHSTFTTSLAEEWRTVWGEEA